VMPKLATRLGTGVDKKVEFSKVSVCVAATLGVGLECEAVDNICNPVSKETREGIAKDEMKHIARLNTKE